MIGLTPPVEGGSQRHIYEISSRIDCNVLTQKNSICKNKIELPIIKLNNFLINLSFFLSCLFYSIKLLIIKKYDIIHIHENLLYLIAPILRLRYKVIITIHGISGFKFYDIKFLWFFFKQGLKSADRIISVSLSDKNLLENEFGNINYLPNGVDVSGYEKIKVKIQKKITFIGRIHEQKGILYLLKAFWQIKSKIPEYKLEIIGKPNPYSIELQKRFADKKIIWKGYIGDRDNLIRNLKSSFCIVLPSLWEGLPLTLFESLASSRPVIISDIPAFKSVIKNQALFFKTKKPEDLAEKLFSLIKNRKKAEELGKQGKILAKKYDWGQIADKTEKLYKNEK